MTQLFEKAFSEASALPELQQNILERWIIDELLASSPYEVKRNAGNVVNN